MDSATLHQMILQNPHLVTSYAGVWSADNFPKQSGTWSKTKPNQTQTRLKSSFVCQTPRLVWFQIVNTSPVGTRGKHWILVGGVVTQRKRIRVFIWDCLGKSLSHYKTLVQRLKQLYNDTGFWTIHLRLQNLSSNMCGIYCLFMVDYIARNPTKVPRNIDQKLKNFTEVDIIRFINCRYHTFFRYTVV